MDWNSSSLCDWQLLTYIGVLQMPPSMLTRILILVWNTMMIVDLTKFKKLFWRWRGNNERSNELRCTTQPKDWPVFLGESRKTLIECESLCVEIYGASGMIDFVETYDNLRPNDRYCPLIWHNIPLLMGYLHHGPWSCPMLEPPPKLV